MFRKILLLAGLLLAGIASNFAVGQSFSIKTFAGGYVPNNVAGTSVGFTTPASVAVDSKGNVFFSVLVLNTVFRLDAVTGLVTPVAGNGTPGNSGDNGPATLAQLNPPFAIALDSAGSLYISDGFFIRKVSAGVITTISGSSTNPGFAGDGGPALLAQFGGGPTGLVVDSAGSVYIADYNNHRIRKVANGIVTTIAGTGNEYFSGDNGPAIDAGVTPQGLAFDSTGNLYFTDGGQRIRKITNGIVTTVAGSGLGPAFTGDNGPATSAALSRAQGVAVDAAGNIFIADTTNNRIREVSNGIITTIAGGGGNPGDGPATSAFLWNPAGIAVDAAGNVYFPDPGFADNYLNRIRKISNGMITAAAGNGSVNFGGDNGPAINAQLLEPNVVTADASGNVYIADGSLYQQAGSSSRIREVVKGVINTVNGGYPLYANGMTTDTSGNLYISHGEIVSKLVNGTSTLVAGTGTSNALENYGGFGGDNGPAVSAIFYNPSGLAFDAAGDLYIADYGNGRIREIVNGIINTVVGGGSNHGDNVPPTSALLSGPTGVAMDAAGNLYIADTPNHRIRKVANGVITTVAGNGTAGFSGDNGPAASAQLNNPQDVAVNAAGDVYIADTGNNSIRMVSNGIITTLAGNGTAGYGGDDGPAIGALLNMPVSVALDTAGNLYIADLNNNRIREITQDQPSGQPVTLAAVQNAASYSGGAVSPGEIVVLWGAGMGPSELAVFPAIQPSSFPTQLDGAQILFNGIAAPMVYTQSGQAAAVVPYGVGAAATANVVVKFQGQSSAPLSVPVVATVPGLFTAAANGQGLAAANNQDGSIHSVANPAKLGSIISLWATGEGQTLPSGADGKIAVAPLPHPVQAVSVMIGGLPAVVQYAGGAPGEVAGVMQVNVQIPTGVTPGTAVPVVLSVGGVNSQSGVTIAVSGN